MTTEAARVELKDEAMITGKLSFCPSRMNLRRSVQDQRDPKTSSRRKRLTEP